MVRYAPMVTPHAAADDGVSGEEPEEGRGSSRLVSVVKLAGGIVLLAVLVPIALALLIPLLPWRWTRVRLSNSLGMICGSGIMWLSRCPLTVEGRERISSDRPAIYAGNHTSIYDTFLSIWLSPVGTVGVAKKEIVYYPLFGLAWLLSGNLSIDRSDPERAKKSLSMLARVVRERRLHLFMWPEGRRSHDGRLLPFKKGIIHLAIETKLPIVPMVIQGAHRAWAKATLSLRKVPIKVTFLPPIDTRGWSEDRIDEHLETVRRAFIGVLPPDQQPIDDVDFEAA
jgi:1-acyl-sn-glycerol-3-phosphate acyltransferase